jgi:hypothetical protein
MGGVDRRRRNYLWLFVFFALDFASNLRQPWSGFVKNQEAGLF